MVIADAPHRKSRPGPANVTGGASTAIAGSSCRSRSDEARSAAGRRLSHSRSKLIA